MAFFNSFWYLILVKINTECYEVTVNLKLTTLYHLCTVGLKCVIIQGFHFIPDPRSPQQWATIIIL